MIDTARGIFKEEDALIQSVLGVNARDEWRASELRSRTSVMAILAALGERPFDDSLGW